MKVSQTVLFRYCLNSQTNSYLSKRRARLLIESFLRFRNLLFAIGKQKKMIIKEEPIYWRRILSPKTVIFLLRGLIPKFWDRYQRLRNQRISYNNLKKKHPHNPFFSGLLNWLRMCWKTGWKGSKRWKWGNFIANRKSNGYGVSPFYG